MNHSRFPLLPLIVILLALSAWCAPGLRRATERQRMKQSLSRSESTMRLRNDSVFGAILGEVRASAADLMWVKMNRYVHAGVGYMTETNLGQVDEDEHFSGCQAGMATVIRGAAGDFRGFLGDMERQVKPYKHSSEAHTHTANAELIPWFRLITLSDPHFIRGYRVGAYTLRTEGHWQKALEFLEEGIAKNQDNPELFVLYVALASFHAKGHFTKAYLWPDEWLDRALPAARKGYELALPHRPPDGKMGVEYKGMLWSENMEDDFHLGAHLYLMLLRQKQKDTGDPEMKQRLIELARIMPDQMPYSTPVRHQAEEILKKYAEEQP